MRRRDFVKAVAGTAAAWPLATRAQQPGMPVIGFLHSSSPVAVDANVHGFRQGLVETGYIEGNNVAIEYRWAENDYERLPSLAADLVRRHVALIIAAGGSRTGLAAQAATKDNSGRVHGRGRSRQIWACRQSQSTRRQSHRHRPIGN